LRLPQAEEKTTTLVVLLFSKKRKPGVKIAGSSYVVSMVALTRPRLEGTMQRSNVGGREVHRQPISAMAEQKVSCRRSTATQQCKKHLQAELT